MNTSAPLPPVPILSSLDANFQQNGMNQPSKEQQRDKEERLSDVQFEEAVSDSNYIKPMRMHFRRRGRQHTWDMAFEHDNVAALIYHTGRKQLLLVKQFRPPVFIHAIRSRPENAQKPLNDIQWEQYPIECGHTLELCAGLMDKAGKSPLEHIQEEILEECGYRVPTSSILPIKRYMTGISISGAVQHLFYVELDESMREAAAGGGNAMEGEYIQNIFLGIDEAKALTEQEHVVAPPSMLFALIWWQNNKKHQQETREDEH